MNKKFCIGILGGGQLAKMSTLAASGLGFDISIMEKNWMEYLEPLLKDNSLL